MVSEASRLAIESQKLIGPNRPNTSDTVPETWALNLARAVWDLAEAVKLLSGQLSDYDSWLDGRQTDGE